MGKMNRYERRELQKRKLANDMGGSGIFIYQNNSNGDLKLPKKTTSGRSVVGPNEKFQGDSYFMNWVKPPVNLLRLVETIVPEDAFVNSENKMEETMNEEKLILDQPDTVTSEGKVEHVVQNPSVPLNDSHDQSATKDVLLNEDPMDGVEIII